MTQTRARFDAIPILSLGAAMLAAALAMPAIAGPVVPSGNPPTTNTQLSPLEAKMAEGYVALGAKDLAAAQVAFTEAGKLDAKAPGPLLGLAEVARLSNNAPEAEKWLKRALEVAPQSADAQRAWGRYQFAQRNFTLAETALKKAAALDPDSAPTQFDLGDLYLNWLHRPADAAAAYRQAIKLQRAPPCAHFSSGVVLASLGKTARPLRIRAGGNTPPRESGAVDGTRPTLLRDRRRRQGACRPTIVRWRRNPIPHWRWLPAVIF